jgi:hypothetical protein
MPDTMLPTTMAGMNGRLRVRGRVEQWNLWSPKTKALHVDSASGGRVTLHGLE